MDPEVITLDSDTEVEEPQAEEPQVEVEEPQILSINLGGGATLHGPYYDEHGEASYALSFESSESSSCVESSTGGGCGGSIMTPGSSSNFDFSTPPPTPNKEVDSYRIEDCVNGGEKGIQVPDPEIESKTEKRKRLDIQKKKFQELRQNVAVSIPVIDLEEDEEKHGPLQDDHQHSVVTSTGPPPDSGISTDSLLKTPLSPPATPPAKRVKRMPAVKNPEPHPPIQNQVDEQQQLLPSLQQPSFMTFLGPPPPKSDSEINPGVVLKKPPSKRAKRMPALKTQNPEPNPQVSHLDPSNQTSPIINQDVEQAGQQESFSRSSPQELSTSFAEALAEDPQNFLEFSQLHMDDIEQSVNLFDFFDQIPTSNFLGGDDGGLSAMFSDWDTDIMMFSPSSIVRQSKEGH